MQQLNLFNPKSPKSKSGKKPPPFEWKIVPLRECARPYGEDTCDRPELAVEYWRCNVATAPHFNPMCECFTVILLNTRRRITGHHLVGIGLLDQVLVHPREVFRAAIIAAAHSVILMHNHPSGDPTPSFADLKITRELIQAGRLLRIEVTDHLIIGHPRHQSLRELGHFHS